MRHVVVLHCIVLGLAVASPALAQPSVSDALLFATSTGPELRARLLAHADSVTISDPREAARALAYVALSAAREGEPDSAVAMYQRAFELDSVPRRRMEFAEALLLRQATGDAELAREVLRPIQPLTPEFPEVTDATAQGSFAWAHYLTGHADSAALLMAPVEAWLSDHHEWRYRMACVAAERADWTRALALLTPLAVASRNSDSDVIGLMKLSAENLNAGRFLQPQLIRELTQRDAIEAELLADLGARRVSFTGQDGFPLGGTLLVPRARARPRAAVVLVEPRDTLALYDTLAVGLRRIGLAVLLLDPRGSGRSVAPGCPLPDSWRGREAEMEFRCAEDVREAVRVLGREAKADTSRYLVIGVGSTTPIAVEAARLDRRAAVLMLVSPTPSPVDRGAMRASLAAMRRPVYFQTAPEDYTTWPVIDSLYRACDQRASRVADTNLFGTHAALFRRGHPIMERFRRWLEESWPRPTAPRATPPPRSRKR